MKFSSNRVTVADTFSKKFKFRDTRKKMIRTTLKQKCKIQCEAHHLKELPVPGTGRLPGNRVPGAEYQVPVSSIHMNGDKARNFIWDCWYRDVLTTLYLLPAPYPDIFMAYQVVRGS
jgi:hypothetical protein